jgi:hypothetical protein
VVIMLNISVLCTTATAVTVVTVVNILIYVPGLPLLLWPP